MRTSENHTTIALLVVWLGAITCCGLHRDSLLASEYVSSLGVQQGERIMIILKDGSEVLGELVEETEDSISVKSVFGVTTIESSRIEEIIRGAEVDRREFLKREKSANRRGSAKAFIDLARWASERGLETQATTAYQRALELDPNNEAAKIGLGWGQLSDGSWKKPAEVKELIARGWTLSGGSLTAPASSGVGESQGGARKKDVEEAPTPDASSTPAVPESVSEKLTPDALKRRERELERRRKDREKFEEKKRREYEGVPWPSRSKIKSRNCTIFREPSLHVLPA